MKTATKPVKDISDIRTGDLLVVGAACTDFFGVSTKELKEFIKTSSPNYSNYKKSPTPQYFAFNEILLVIEEEKYIFEEGPALFLRVLFREQTYDIIIENKKALRHLRVFGR